MPVDIIIPTCKTPERIAPLMCNLEGFALDHNIIATCLNESAAVNRNAGLDRSASEIIIMIDDDIAGFYEGWIKDLIHPLSDESIMIVSARLLKPDGTIGATMFSGDASAPGYTQVPRVPTAAIAFRRNKIRFYEGYLKSGFEDDHFCAEMQELFPSKKIVINNSCKLIHINEQKGQGEAYAENKKLFDMIWETSADGTKRTRRKMYYGEYEEDRWVNENIFRFKREGVFFEAGAIDGVLHSNTLFFEKELGWTGLLVEANPEEFQKIKNTRICKQYSAAVYDQSEGADFLAVKGRFVGWGGIKESIEDQHAARIQQDISADKQSIIKVPCKRLDELLKMHEMKKIDFLSLDIEGAEFRVLKSFPFSDFDVTAWAIENNYGTYPIELLMVSNGYKKVAELGVTEIYRKANPPGESLKRNTDGFWGIPKILHFVWLGSEMPAWVKCNIAEFKHLNPEFQIKIHGEEGLDPIFSGRYERINEPVHGNSMKSDLIRVSRLMNEGGWFFDCDFWPLVSIREMCDHMDLSQDRMPLFASYDNDIVLNGVLGCRKEDLGIKLLADLILTRGYPKPNWWDYGSWCTWRILRSNPECFTRTDMIKVLSIFNRDTEACRKNVLRIMGSEERIQEIKNIGGWAIHYGMCGGTDVGDIYPLRKYAGGKDA